MKFILLFLLGCAPGTINLTNEYVITALRDNCASGVTLPEGSEVLRVQDCWYDEQYEYHCEDTRTWYYNDLGDLVIEDITYECVITCQ